MLTSLRLVCLLRLQQQNDAEPVLRYVIFECQHGGEIIDLLGFDFFDDESLVVVYRHRNQGMSFLC